MVSRDDIPLEDFLRLNEFALSDSPSSQENLSRALRARRSVPEGFASVVVWESPVDSIRQDVECEAILDFPPELQHPVQEAAACVSMLRRHEDVRAAAQPQFTARHSPESIQRRLSHLLVRYPLLLDHRCLIRVAGSTPKYSSIAIELAKLSFGSLPRARDGFSSRDLRLFATNNSVRSGLSRAFMAPGTGNRAHDHSPLTVLYSGVHPPRVAGANRGSFLLSLLRLSQLSRDFTGRPIVHVNRTAAETHSFFVQLAKVFFDCAVDDGRCSGVTRAELLEALRLGSPFAKGAQEAGSDPEAGLSVAECCDGRLRNTMKSQVDAHLFGVQAPNPINGSLQPTGREGMRERTGRVIDLMAEGGLAKDPREAAAWLAEVCVGNGRVDRTTAGPLTSMEAAVGFLEALHVHGVHATVDTPVESAALPAGNLHAAPLLQQRSRERSTARDLWASAVDVHARTVAMESVLEAWEGPAAGQTPAHPIARRVRRSI